jgi:phage-related protein
MRFSAAAFATAATALPLLNLPSLGDTVGLITGTATGVVSGAVDTVGKVVNTTADVADDAVNTAVGTATAVVGGAVGTVSDVAGGAVGTVTDVAGGVVGKVGTVVTGVKGVTGDVVTEALHIVWTNVQGTVGTSLTVLDAAGELVLAHTCGSKLVTGVFEAVPIDFTGVDANGVGSFIYGAAELPIISDAVEGVTCVVENLKDVAVVDCLVPAVSSLTLNVVSEVNDITTCLIQDLPIVGELPGLVNALL